MSEPKLWSVADIAAWLQMDVSHVAQRIVWQQGFPKGFRPSGKERGEMRWFAEDVIGFYRQKAA